VVHGAVKSLFQLLGAVAAGLLLALPLFAWRLSTGPISLDVLTPYIEEALTAKDGSLIIRLDTTVLASGSGDRMLELRARNVRAYTPASDHPIASVPEVSLSLSGRALMGGVLAPYSVRLYGPHVHLVRDASGALLWGIGGGGESADAGEVVRDIKDALLGQPDAGKPGRHLQVFTIKNADLLVEDRALGTSWHAPDADISVRRTTDGVATEGKLRLDLAGEPGELSINAAYHKADESADGALRFTDIHPSVLARLGGPLAQLSAIDTKLAGTVRARIEGNGSLGSLSWDITGGAGALQLPPPLAAHHKIARAVLRGSLSQGTKRLDLTELTLDLGGPTVSLTGTAEGLGGETVVKADGMVREVPVDSVHDLWPEGLAPNARNWVIPNLKSGTVHEARVALALHSASGRFDDVVMDHLGGDIHVDGVTVDYLRPMPMARNTSAVCTYDASTFRIALKAGEVYGLKLREGMIILGGLDQALQTADIDLQIAGPATDALRLIDNPPLRYATALGVEPGKVSGDALARVRLKFPLLKALRLDDIGIKAHASLKGAAIPQVMMGLDLTDSNLELDVDAKGLDATGKVVLGTIPASLVWRENFSAKTAPFRSRYQLQAPAVSEAQRKLLGLDRPPFVSPFISGPAAANVTATFMEGGRGEIEAKADLTPSGMSLPGLGWQKDVGKPGSAEVSVRLDKKKVSSVPRFVVTAGDLNARGSVSFTADGAARRVEFQKLAYGRTDGEGSIVLRPKAEGGGLDIAFRGSSFDGQPLISRNGAAPAEDSGSGSDLPPMSVAATVKTLWLSDHGSVANASASLQRDEHDWHTLTLKGGLGGGKIFSASLQQGNAKRRNFIVGSDDAGAVMRAFDIYDDLVGGKLSVDGYIDDTQKAQPFIGTARVSDYHIRNAPALARLLTVAALTGIVDVLQGEGVSFSSMEAPFTLSNGLLEFRDARAWGPALGITARGQIDLDHSRMALEGTVVPAYVLNSALGKIPVLGWLITGGETGGGVIAFNYSMKGPTHDPGVVVNPLSALTPGFLRNLFNIFDNGSETDARGKTGK
jgi:hypothetical protein